MNMSHISRVPPPGRREFYVTAVYHSERRRGGNRLKDVGGLVPRGLVPCAGMQGAVLQFTKASACPLARGAVYQSGLFV